jgi:hypothetical protein
MQIIRSGSFTRLHKVYQTILFLKPATPPGIPSCLEFELVHEPIKSVEPDRDAAPQEDLADLAGPKTIHLPDLANRRLTEDIGQDFADVNDAVG